MCARTNAPSVLWDSSSSGGELDPGEGEVLKRKKESSPQTHSPVLAAGLLTRIISKFFKKLVFEQCWRDEIFLGAVF